MRLRALALALAAAALAAAGTSASGADFVAASASPANGFSTAADFNTVAVSVADPGATLHGTLTLSATASSERGIASVRIQAAPAGTQTWADLCTPAAAPYDCRWDSSAIASGTYDLRALATDAAGYSRASAIVASRTVDNVGPTVTLTDPGALAGVRTISASAADTGTGVATLALEYRRPGATTWTPLCTGSGSSLSCPLDTRPMAEGDLELHAVAVDGAGNARSSAPLTRLIDNTPPAVSASDPGALVHGTTGITVSASDSGAGIASVTVQIRPKGQTTWITACVDTTAPYTCSGDTHQLPDGVYEVRAIATDSAGLATIAQTGESRVDNTAPSASALDAPGAVLSASAALTGSAADAGAGIGSWRLEYASSGTSTWRTACTATSAPYGCSWDTTAAADGLYDLRAIATDLAGNATASALRTGIRVDNDGPAVTFAGPAALLRGAVALSAGATDPMGVSSVVFERAPVGGSAWTAICTSTTAPYGCSWDTTAVADGNYDVRARAVDGLGHSASVKVSTRQVDNTAPAPADVQAGNGGAATGSMEPQDWLRLTFSEPVAPGSVLAGWAGGAQAVTLRVIDGGASDTLALSDAAGTTPLALASALALNADMTDGGAVWNATMTRSGAAITVTLGSLRSGTVKHAAAATMGWTAATAVTDLAGNAATSGPAGESGAVDEDF